MAFRLVVGQFYELLGTIANKMLEKRTNHNFPLSLSALARSLDLIYFPDNNNPKF